MVEEVYIYSLKDPNNFEVRYVGKTKFSLDERLRQHLSDAKKIINKSGTRKNNKRYSWIISLLKYDELPIIELIEKVDYSIWKEREKFWISQFNNLTNMTKGGDGGDTNSGRKFGKKSCEEKKLISEKTKIAMDRPEIKEKVRKGAYMTLSKILGSNNKLRGDIVEKIREASKKKVNVLSEGVFVERMSSIEDFIKKYKTSYSTFNRKPKKIVDKEYYIDLNEF